MRSPVFPHAGVIAGRWWVVTAVASCQHREGHPDRGSAEACVYGELIRGATWFANDPHSNVRQWPCIVCGVLTNGAIMVSTGDEHFLCDDHRNLAQLVAARPRLRDLWPRYQPDEEDADG